ncbi:MAG TPA: hypothetical protein VK607_10695 [Kofleriaceae bacterium]|nr:hypothetical protein [Kofleriaceae bacterium]
MTDSKDKTTAPAQPQPEEPAPRNIKDEMTPEQRARHVAATYERALDAHYNAEQDLRAARRAGELKLPRDGRIASTNPTGHLAVGPAGQVVTIPVGQPLKSNWKWAGSGDVSKAKEAAAHAKARRQAEAQRARKE